MALTPIVDTDTASGVDITSAQTIGSYSPAAARMIGARLKLSSLNAAAATFTVAFVDSNGDAMAAYSMPKYAAADVVAYLPFDPLLVLAAETVSLSILSSNASDTSVTWAVSWIDAHRVDVQELAGGQYKIADTTGNWATVGTWSDGVVPAAGDNIIIRDGVTVTIAASLDLGTFGMQEVQGDGVLNIAGGQTVAVVPAGWVIGTNAGTITTNNGTITDNLSATTTNAGTITTNNGTISINNGPVTINASTVTTNNGTISVNSNAGTITTNAGTVATNIGTVTTNNAGGIVLHNYGTIGTDNGESDVPRVTLVDTTTVNTDLVTTTGTEEASVPAAAPSIRTMIQWVYQKIRNKETSTSSAATVSKDDGTTTGTSTLSDTAGTFTKSEQV